MVLIEPPMNVIAAIASTAMSARMSAYSARPWPLSPLRTSLRTEDCLTLQSTSTFTSSKSCDAKRMWLRG